MKLLDTLTVALKLPAAYRFFRQAVGGRNGSCVYLDEYVRPIRGEKVLDIGCGPGDMLNFLPNVDYLGLDISPKYIEAAKARFGNRGRFCCGDVGLATIEQEHGTFSLAMATGVLHHLDDQTATKLFELARIALGPGGRLITFDGCYVPKQSGIARWILDHDRGKFVRTRPEYERLASRCFAKVESYVRHDLLRIPYSHLIMRCSN
jgi:SAM-dependent methyltransferase